MSGISRDDLDAYAKNEFIFDSSVDIPNGLLYFKDGLPVGEIKIVGTRSTPWSGTEFIVEIFNFKNKLREENDN